MQRKYKKVFKQANKEKIPVVVFAHNQPLGAVIGLDLLEKIQMDLIVIKTLKEYQRSKTVLIDDFAGFENEIRKAAK